MSLLLNQREESMEKDRGSCKVCGNTFNTVTRNVNSLYCSDRCRNKSYRDKHKDAPHGIMARYKSSAKERGFEFSLTVQDFKDSMSADCGDKLIKAAFDRVDSSIGYVPDNIVPCCWECNAMKRARTSDDFLSRCKRITERHNQ